MEQRIRKEAENPAELMAEYKRTKDIELRNQLVMHYADAIKHTIINMRAMLPQHIPQEEFFNQGVIALIDCIEKFDPDRGVSFTTFIYKRLRGAMLSYMRKHSWLPYRVRAARRSIQQARTELSNRLMREPSDRELADFLEIPETELVRSLQEIATADMVSFEELVDGGSGMSASWDASGFGAAENMGGGQDEGVDHELMREELQGALAEAVEGLSPKERQVISLSYYENLNLREIGEVLGVSMQRVSYIRAGALGKLRKVMMEYLYGKD